MTNPVDLSTLSDAEVADLLDTAWKRILARDYGTEHYPLTRTLEALQKEHTARAVREGLFADEELDEEREAA